jgi:hypothetical protein
MERITVRLFASSGGPMPKLKNFRADGSTVTLEFERGKIELSISSKRRGPSRIDLDSVDSSSIALTVKLPREKS